MSKMSRFFLMSLVCFRDYLSDYKAYIKYNYNNPFRNDQDAVLAKLLRQTHTIEKGMAISNPRVGFGTAKVADLLDLLDNYVALSYDTKKTGFQNAIATLKSYKDFQELHGFCEKNLFDRIQNYEKQYLIIKDGGIKRISLNDLQEKKNGNFEQFMISRHSIRQFDETDIDVKLVRKAVDLAKYAPTACNRQAYNVYLYSDKKKNDQIGELIAGNTGFQSEVKQYLIITGKLSSFYDSFERNQVYIEAGIFTMALSETLHYYGIANCVLQNGERRKIQKKLRNLCREIGEDEKIITFIAIGNYKKEVVYAVSNRKTVDEILKVK